MQTYDIIRILNITVWIGMASYSLSYGLSFKKFFYFFFYSVIWIVLLPAPFYINYLKFNLGENISISVIFFIIYIEALIIQKIIKTGLIELRVYKKIKFEFSNTLIWVLKFSPLILLGIILLPLFMLTLIILGIIVTTINVHRTYLNSNENKKNKTLIIFSFLIYCISALVLGSFFILKNVEINMYYYSISEIYITIFSLVLTGLWTGQISKLQARNIKRIIEIERDQQIELKKVNESLNEKIKSETEKLNEILSIKKFYLGIISHDLRGPLNEAIFLLKQENKKNKGFIQSQIDRLETINESFYLFLNWIEAKNFNKSRVFKVLNLDDQLNNILLEFEDAIGSKNIQIKKSVASDLTLFFNYIFIETILRNIIGNAIKFNRLNGFIEIIAIKRAHFTSIAIKDNGEGVFQAHIDGILANPVNKIGTKKEDSFGFGLFICKEIIEQYGGSIKVKSKPNSGTTVVLKFRNENKTINS
jgi:signal transduction histidine kinase